MEDDLDENMGVFDDGEAEDTEQDVAEASAVATTYQHSTMVYVFKL